MKEITLIKLFRSITLNISKRKPIFSFTIILLLFFTASLNAQTVTVPAGSLVIDMGVVPQTIENGIKPYGLVYELINVRKVPVIWSINPLKAKDGVDFTVDGRDFRGGPFIIDNQFLLDSNVQTSIATWEAKGVVTYTTLTEVEVDLFEEISVWPKWVLDTANGNIARGYLELAEIPASAYVYALPKDLLPCDDLFILPHADPTWTDHGRLHSWTDSYANGGSAGWLWSGCHAASVLEALVDPGDPTKRMNFLAVDPSPYPDPAHLGFGGYGLVDFNDHADGSGMPYSYGFPGNPVMQFLGTLDGATDNGSEQIYLPYPTGGWRPSTTVSIWDPNQIDLLNGDTPGRAAKIVYGFAFGNTTSGKIMYQGGHDLNNGTLEERIAAMRAFLNFSFDAPTGKAPLLTENSVTPLTVEGGETLNFDIDASSGTGNSFSFTWTTTCASGSFSGTTNTTTNTTTSFVTTPVTSNEACIVRLIVTDDCGKESFLSYGITIIPEPTAPVANDDNYFIYDINNISLDPLNNDTDINFNINPASFTPTSPLVVAGGTFVDNGNGDIDFIANIGFAGTAILNYQICDDTPAIRGGPLCDTATITVNVVASPCGLNEPVSSVTDYAVAVVNDNNWSDEDRALGAPDTDFSRSNNDIGAFLVLDLGDNAFVGSKILFRVF
ncbi:MAG: Ig-like domain-containing protein, partial [Aureibaculum sp.]|nr:Ig-like domain-containing protein [Aureibaculum sp.]